MGLGSFGVASIMITGILPLLTGNNQYAHFSPLATLLFLLPTGYAIVRHRLLDVSFVVVRGAAYTVLVGLAAALIVVLAVIGGESVAAELSHPDRVRGLHRRARCDSRLPAAAPLAGTRERPLPVQARLRP